MTGSTIGVGVVAVALATAACAGLSRDAPDTARTRVGVSAQRASDARRVGSDEARDRHEWGDAGDRRLRSGPPPAPGLRKSMVWNDGGCTDPTCPKHGEETRRGAETTHRSAALRDASQRNLRGAREVIHARSYDRAKYLCGTARDPHKPSGWGIPSCVVCSELGAAMTFREQWALMEFWRRNGLGHPV
jgi:hypothetical protein